MSQTILNIAAICDKAGRSVNQDNFWICPDLTTYTATGEVAIESSDTNIALTEKGALFVVADGMGGMSAGEVASQLVIDAVKQTFLDLGSVDLSNAGVVKQFIRQTIIKADVLMKKHAQANPDTAGMGSTIVLIWLLGETVYVGWCGDSRAYCYNAQNGLVRLTHDHSYVQELVDKGLLSEEDAFDHPHSNIITRSLGDSGEEAEPEVKSYPIHTGDIFLLCSDGLCGLLQDQEIEHTMAQNDHSIRDCLNALWRQGATIGWTDNTTIELAKIVEGGIAPTDVPVGYEVSKVNPAPKSQSTQNTTVKSSIQPARIVVTQPRTRRMPSLYVAIAIVATLLVGLVLGVILTRKYLPSTPKAPDHELVAPLDSLRVKRITLDDIPLNPATGALPLIGDSIKTATGALPLIGDSIHAATAGDQQQGAPAQSEASSATQVTTDSAQIKNTIKTEDLTTIPQASDKPKESAHVPQTPATQETPAKQGTPAPDADQNGLTAITDTPDDSKGNI